MLIYKETIFFPGNIYLFKLNNKNIEKQCDMSKVDMSKKDTRTMSIHPNTQFTSVWCLNLALILLLILLFLICTNGSSLKLMKNAFYFKLKALLILKIFT